MPGSDLLFCGVSLIVYEICKEKIQHLTGAILRDANHAIEAIKNLLSYPANPLKVALTFSGGTWLLECHKTIA